VDQATATVIGSVVALSGSITAAIIAVKWKSRGEPQHHIYEYRVLYPTEIEREPWIQSTSSLARIVRAVCWIVVMPLIFFGTTTLIWTIAVIAGLFPLLDQPEPANQRLVVIALLRAALLP
jgi:hypothetical protein